MEWKQQFEIIKKEISHRLARDGRKWSNQNAADLLNVNIGKIRAWEKGQRPAADDLALFARALEFSPKWLLLGTGPQREALESPPPPPVESIPPEELSEKLTPTQREMLTCKRLMVEIGASPDQIVESIKAIALSKTCQPTPKSSQYPTAEPETITGYNHIHEPKADFGKGI